MTNETKPQMPRWLSHVTYLKHPTRVTVCTVGMVRELSAFEEHLWWVCSKITGKGADPAPAAGIKKEPSQVQASKAPLLLYCLPEIQKYESPRGFESLRQSAVTPSPSPLHHHALFLRAKSTDAGTGGSFLRQVKPGSKRAKKEREEVKVV